MEYKGWIFVCYLGIYEVWEKKNTRLLYARASKRIAGTSRKNTILGG